MTRLHIMHAGLNLSWSHNPSGRFCYVLSQMFLVFFKFCFESNFKIILLTTSQEKLVNILKLEYQEKATSLPVTCTEAELPFLDFSIYLGLECFHILSSFFFCK